MVSTSLHLTLIKLTEWIWMQWNRWNNICTPFRGKLMAKKYLYVSYGVYGDVERTDNDYQAILRYNISDWKKYEADSNLRGLNQEGKELFLAEVGEVDETSGVRGYYFPYGATGIISLGDGYFYFSQNYKNENGYGTNVKLYQYEVNKGFHEV